MNLLKRLFFFSLGMLIGLLFLIIYNKNNFFSYNYLPNGRVLNNFLKKDVVISKKCYNLLPNKLKFFYNPIFFKKKVFKIGRISFSESYPRKKPFPIYKIYFKNKKINKIYIFKVENQIKKVIILNIKKLLIK